MKYKFYFTPYGLAFALLAIGCLASAALVNGLLANILLWLGLLFLVIGYWRTYLNIHRINQKVEREQRRQVQEAGNKENEEYFRKHKKEVVKSEYRSPKPKT